jgi:hypothetical protein
MKFQYFGDLWALARGRRNYFLMTAMLPIVILFGFLSVQPPVCVDDCDGYVVLMGMAPWHKSFWVVLHHAFRGWTIPVFYSAFGSYSAVSAQVIVVAQAFLLLVATIVFAAAVASRFAPRRRWWIGVTVAIMLAFQQGYLLFSSFLISDSLTWALVLLLLATIVAADWLLLRFGYLRYALFYVAVGWMSVGARDANQQLLIAFTAYLLVMQYARLTRKQIIALAAGVLCFCALEAHTAHGRFYINMENVLVGRILPDPEARSFFVQHGMPSAYANLGESLPLQALNGGDVDAVVQGRSKFERIGIPYLGAAPKTYVLWLISHPGRTAHTLFANRAFIFASDFLWLESGRLHLATVARRLQTGSQVDDRPQTPYFALRWKLLALRPSLMERLPLLLRFAILLLLPAWGAWRNARAFFRGVGGFAALIGAVGIINACSGFMADSWQLSEMERHAAVGNMLFNAGTLILLLWAAQEVAVVLSRRRAQTERPVALPDREVIAR